MPAPVLIASLEDGADELRRRILAARIHHGIERGELKGWLFLAALGTKDGKLMVLDPKGQPVPGKLGAKLVNTIINRGIDLVLLDPFIKTHGVPENNNNGIDEVASIFTAMALSFGIAIDAPHHMSKGPPDPGNASKGRSASSLKDAFRLVRTLTPMSADEAKAFGIDEVERRRLVRVDDAKVNIVPSAEASWFRLVGVDIGNGTELYPNGDSVQTVEVWIPPELFADVSSVIINRILDELDAGLPDGNRYSNAPNTDRPAWRVVQKHCGKDEGPCRQMIQTWLKSELLSVEVYDNPSTRKPVKGLSVVNARRPS
ncbi:helicase RepA family protein [Bosea sp. BH3]|uniref:helicase RepA family protein n=1 Tax=Bosea sp. BH3 TaxID=2871701 RepID=UPI0021CB87B2|nr:helicase RepA family protein [Bosea sp. BH3]MCU4180672.1 helicase RepA family protein [Bosea sp. BH3]